MKQGHWIGKGYEPEQRSPGAKVRGHTPVLKADTVLWGCVSGEYRQQVNGPGVQQKGMEAPATKLELGQATGLQTGVGNVAKEPP